MTQAAESLPVEPAVLKAGEKQNVQYAIPLWLRDIQIRHALSRIKARVEPVDQPRSDPVAIVCFGPSLKQTWEQIKGFNNIITCSGAHKFLVERGIIPTIHIEVDPRAHKVELIGAPQAQTEYWISSTCHKAVFDHLEGFNVKLWHVFDGQYESARIIPPGEWALTGGCGVGLRAFTAATFCGFRDIHVFGMDGSEGEDGRKHAADHPNEPQKHALVEFPEGSGRMWKTTPSMYEAARQTVYEMEQLSKARFTFYGEGLVQAMVKEWKPREVELPTDNIDAIQRPEIITPTYRDLNAKLHQDNALYGASGHRHAETVKRLAVECKCESVLDFGCGKGTLAAHLPFPIWEYDPAIPGKDELPRPADLVCCFDVLEHVEPEMLRNVLTLLSKITKKVGFFVIATRPAKKTLADGRNAHLLVKPREWWEKKLNQFFDVGQLFDAGGEIHAVVGPRTAGKLDNEGVVKVEHDGTRVAFYCPNDTTRWRASTLMKKEPATIAWIDTFKAGDVLWDVGANVGGYTVWAAARRGVKVMAFEPEAQNYSLLVRNMALNGVDGTAYCLALSSHQRLDTLHVATQGAGGSCNSFGAAVGPDLKERKGRPQGCIGFSAEDLIQMGAPAPTHIKIDVDGFEHLVIQGARALLQWGDVKSLLVEVNDNLPEHRQMLKELESMGYRFDPAQAEQARRKDGPFKGCAEHVFVRESSIQAHIRKAIEGAELVLDPTPHLYVRDVLPQAVYDELESQLPDDSAYQPILTARKLAGYPERSVATDFPRPEWMDILRPLLLAKFGIADEGFDDEHLLIRDKPGYQIGPHTDSPARVLSAILYLAPDSNRPDLGTWFYRPRQEGFTCKQGKHYNNDRQMFRPATLAEYQPNSMVVFLRTDASFHGVEPTDKQRDVLLYDIRRAPCP